MSALREQPTEEYGPKVTVCQLVPKKNCYRTPRTVRVMKMLNMTILICFSLDPEGALPAHHPTALPEAHQLLPAAGGEAELPF